MSAAGEGLLALVPAVITALKARSQLTSLLDSATAVYGGRTPNPTSGAQPSKYLLVRQPSVFGAGVFKSTGGDNALQIDIWYPGGDDLPVLAIYAQIGITLDGVKLTLGGTLRHWSGETSLITIVDDPGTTPSKKHGVVRYEARVN